MDGARRVAALLCGLVLLTRWPGPAHALGLSYPDPVATAVGARGDVTPVLSAGTARWSVEFSERALFDDAGLRVDGARTTLRRGSWHLGVEAARVSTDVGGEASAEVALAYAAPAWMVAVVIDHDTATIGDAAAQGLTAAGLRTGVTVARRARLRCAIGGFRIAGVERGGADIESSVSVEAVDGVAVTSTLVVDRVTGAHARVSGALRLLDRAVLVAGYDDETSALSLAVALFAGGVRGAAGVSAHPVLGLSRGVSVGWSR